MRYGDFLTLKFDKRIYAFVRYDFYERILVVLNKNLIPQAVKIEIPEFYKISSAKNLLNNESRLLEGNTLKVKVNELSYNFYLLE